VKRAVKKSDKSEYAIKMIDKSKLNKEELAVIHDEVDIMKKVKHPNCVQMFDLFDTKKKLCMVLELLRGGELFDRIVKKRHFTEQGAASVVQSVVQAIQYLHKIGVVHRDLKPENLLFLTKEEDSVLKVTDFGLAKFTQVKMATACGTPGYVAPEILSGKPYGPEVDLWSTGVILYILLCGFPPFFDENTANLYRTIKAGKFDFPSPYWDDISDPAKNLVCRLLTVDPKQRATPEQVLAHPWVASGVAKKTPLHAGLADRLQLMQFKRMLRRGVRTLIAINRFERQLTRLLGKQ